MDLDTQAIKDEDLAIHPDRKHVLQKGYDPPSSMKLHEVERYKEIRTFVGHVDGINAAAFDSDGKRAVSASNDKTLKLWNVETGEEMRTFTGHEAAVNSVDFGPDGKRIISGSADGTLKLWDAETGKEIRTLTGHDGSVWSVRFSPNGELAVSTSSDFTIMIWRTEDGSCIYSVMLLDTSGNSVAWTDDNFFSATDVALRTMVHLVRGNRAFEFGETLEDHHRPTKLEGRVAGRP